MTTLYRKHATGKIGTWSIWQEGHTIIMESRVNPNAKATRRIEHVKHGKAGRSIQEQIDLNMNSRLQSKLDGGYKYTEREAQTGSNTNTLSLPQPMLAQRDVQRLDKADTIYSQPKLDGMRMIITRQNGKTFAYTRKGKPVITVNHILAAADSILQDGEYLDGELYAHGFPLQTIMSWAKRVQPENQKLIFHAFDTIDDAPFKERFFEMEKRIIELDDLSIHSVHTTKLTTPVPTVLQRYRKRGFEGAILRDGDSPYQPGKRSKSLIKVKEFFDDEFTILDLTTGARGLPVFVCQTQTGTFRVTIHGTHPEKYARLAQPELYIGQQLTVRHAGLTPYGIPFHPVAIGVREEC
jgi:ATP-dependent DNA ligase